MPNVREQTKIIAGRLFGAVRHSMYDEHFENSEGMNKVSRIVAREEPDYPASFLNFFPEAPQAISRETWIMYDGWMWGVGGAPLQTLCFKWSLYGRYTLRVCETCERRVNPPAVNPFAINEIGSDSSENKEETSTESEPEDEDYEMEH